MPTVCQRVGTGKFCDTPVESKVCFNAVSIFCAGIHKSNGPIDWACRQPRRSDLRLPRSCLSGVLAALPMGFHCKADLGPAEAGEAMLGLAASVAGVSIGCASVRGDLSKLTAAAAAPPGCASAVFVLRGCVVLDAEGAKCKFSLSSCGPGWKLSLDAALARPVDGEELSLCV